MMLVYTALNGPYAALMGVLTSNTTDRTSLASWRFIGAYARGILVTATAGALIEHFGRGENIQVGFETTVTLYAVLACILFWLTFACTTERLSRASVQASKLRKDLHNLITNVP